MPRDLTSTVVGKKGVQSLGPSKLTIKLKPARSTSLLVKFKLENADSVDFIVNNVVTQVGNKNNICSDASNPLENNGLYSETL